MALGGWEISGIVTAISDAPLNIGLAGPNVANIVPNTANRPNINGIMVNPHTVNQWFDTSVFSTPAPGTWGNDPITVCAVPVATTGTFRCSRTSLSMKNAAPISNSARSSSIFGTTLNG